MEKKSVLKFMHLLNDENKVADFIVGLENALDGLTQNNRSFSEAFRAQNTVELAATDSQRSLKAAIALVKGFSSEYAECGEDNETLNRLLAGLEQRAAV
jgi:hypothetical protein